MRLRHALLQVRDWIRRTLMASPRPTDRASALVDHGGHYVNARRQPSKMIIPLTLDPQHARFGMTKRRWRRRRGKDRAARQAPTPRTRPTL